MVSKSPLPTIDGVSPSRVTLPVGPWKNVLAFLCDRFPGVGEDLWRERMRSGRVVDGAGQPITAATPYQAGLAIHYYRELVAEPIIPFEATIVFRDDHLVVADKPHFLPVIPAGRFLAETLLTRLKRLPGLEDLVPLHRIDRGTAGLVAFSVIPRTRGIYQGLFPKREVVKVYQAIAPARPDIRFPLVRRSRIVPGEPFFAMREIDGEPNSETLIEVECDLGDACLYRLTPVTGRKHQLRVHLAALGAPIVNDRVYPHLQDETADDFSRPLQLLAKSLEFRDPLTGERRRFESSRELTG